MKTTKKINKEKFERITLFLPARNSGLGSLQCIMVLKGKKGAVHFIFFINRRSSLYGFFEQSFYTGDVGYHYPVKQHKEQKISENKCEWLDGKPCYCESSTLLAEKLMDILVRRGSEEVWEILEDFYEEIFLNKN